MKNKKMKAWKAAWVVAADGLGRSDARECRKRLGRDVGVGGEEEMERGRALGSRRGNGVVGAVRRWRGGVRACRRNMRAWEPVMRSLSSQ